MSSRVFVPFALILLVLTSPAAIAAEMSVREAQDALAALGHDIGVPDGKSGPKTQAAIKDFQRRNGLPETGQLDAPTSRAIAVARDERLAPPSPASPQETQQEQRLPSAPPSTTETGGIGGLIWLALLGGLAILILRRRSARLTAINGGKKPTMSDTENRPHAGASDTEPFDRIRSSGATTPTWRYPGTVATPPAGPPPSPGEVEVHMRAAGARSQWQPVLAQTPTAVNVSSPPVNGAWKRKGDAVEIAGFLIPGMVYVGRRLPASRSSSNENCLVDATLPVAPSNADRTGTSLPYWPSYAFASPEARRAYLAWHAGGRRDPSYGIGHVFLFFYGLERRLFVDRAVDEVAELIEEVRGLVSVYGDNRSFSGYARKFLEAATVLQGATAAPTLEPSTCWEVPLPVKVGLGRLVSQGQPIPADWMLAWYLGDPETSLRTPAKRCFAEFVALFRKRFDAQFPGGIQVQAPRRKVSHSYEAASRTFSVDMAEFLDGMPDVTVTRKALNLVLPIAESCMDDLDAFSRFLGKNPDGRNSVDAVRLVPAEIREEVLAAPLAEVERWIAEAVPGRMSATTAGEVFLKLGTIDDPKQRPSKSEAVAAAETLGHCGIGIEPDPRFGGAVPKPEDPVVLFRAVAGAPVDHQAADYASAMSLLGLGALLVHGDEEVSTAEEQHLLEHVGNALHFGEAARLRLEAHLMLLLRNPPKFSAVKARFDGLSAERRTEVARFAISVAGADGRIEPAEIKLLERVYTLLGLDAKALFSDLHALGGEEPPLVRKAAPEVGGEPIPRPAPVERPAAPSTVTLDVERLKRIREDTARVSGLLAGIFEDETEERVPAAQPPAPVIEVEPAAAGKSSDSYPGLDAAHSRLLRSAAARGTLPRTDFVALCKAEGLLADGAIETINDWAFEALGDMVIEDGGTVTVMLDLIPFETAAEDPTK